MQAFKDWCKDFYSRITERKFIGFMLATGLCIMGKLSGEWWIAAFGIFCAANASEKIGGPKPPAAQ